MQVFLCFLFHIFREIFEQTKHGKMNTVKLFPQQPNTRNRFLPCFPWRNQTAWKHFPYQKIFSPQNYFMLKIHLHGAKHSLNENTNMLLFRKSFRKNFRSVFNESTDFFFLEKNSDLYLMKIQIYFFFLSFRKIFKSVFYENIDLFFFL